MSVRKTSSYLQVKEKKKPIYDHQKLSCVFVPHFGKPLITKDPSSSATYVSPSALESHLEGPNQILAGMEGTKV